jgi:putative spermidine/putrescine transport system substrate-binding protein
MGAAGLGASALTLPSLLRPAMAQQNGSLTVSTWGGVTEEGVRKVVQPRFEARTGATLVYDIGGQGARYNKLLAQRANPPADVFFSTGEAVVSAYQQDLLLPARKSNIPNFANIREEMLNVKLGADDGTIAGAPYTIISYALGYNPKVTGGPLESWADLWRPEFEDKLAFAAPVHTQMPAFVIIAAELAGGGVDNVDPGFKKLAELRPSKLTVFWTDWASLYQSGDVVVATEFDYYLEGMKEQNFDIDYVYPKEGGIGVPEYVSIVKGTQKQELAEVFLDIMLDPEVQGEFARTTFQGPTNSLVKLTDAEAARCSCGPNLEKIRIFDPEVMAKNRAIWTERMNTEVIPNWRA